MSVNGQIAKMSVASLIAVLAGAAGSLGLMLRAGQHSPRLLLVLFVPWVLAPFVALVLANAVSKRWSVLTRATLYCVMWVVTLGSLAVYGDDALGHRRPQAAFVYVVVPPASCLLVAIALPIAALISGGLSRRGHGA